MPTRGLPSSDLHTDWTSENLLLRRKTSRNVAVCCSMRRKAMALETTTAHDITEKMSRMAKTIWLASDASLTRSMTLIAFSGTAPPGACSARTSDPGVGNEASDVVLL